MRTLTLQFLGAAGTVTGSRHLLSIGESELLVDCGLFQGRKEWRLKNWEPFPMPARSLDAVALTHAHLDHTAYLPRPIKDGFRGPVYRSRLTADLLGIGPLAPADYLVMESTYGDRLHPKRDVGPKLAQVVRDTVNRGGSVIIPAFAVERTQKLLFILRGLMDDRLIPQLPIHIDSPMAIESVKIFMRYGEDFNDDTKAMIKRHGSPVHWPQV